MEKIQDIVMNDAPKHELYFSHFCKFSSAILQELNKAGFQDKFVYLCIDKRVVRNNITYILLPNGREFPLPPMISRVPVLLLKPKFEILSGNQILEYIKPQINTIKQEKTMLYEEPNPFDLNRDTTKRSGVMSDNFSFLDSSPNELTPQGNGGMRQMYTYSGIDGPPTFSTNMEAVEGDKKAKMNYSMEEIEQMRNADFPSVKRA
jgi:hypothetical protein